MSVNVRKGGLDLKILKVRAGEVVNMWHCVPS